MAFSTSRLRRSSLHIVATILLTFAGSALLQAAPPTPGLMITPSAALQVQVLQSIKVGKTTTQNKIDSRLYLGLLNQRQEARLAPLKDFRFVKADSDGRVAVRIVLSDSSGMKQVLNQLDQLGGVIKASSVRARHITARVHLGDLETLAAMPQVLKVRQDIPRSLSKVNTSQGDKTHGADEARGFFGITGAGVKVCVLSDGVDSLTTLEASGDLPPSVDVLPGQAGSGDEGSAMLEIVHDLAPGASLGFAQAGPDEAGFAQNILDLATSGCNIIVDDVVYFDESPFEDSAVAQSVNTVTAAGVLYFSSAGNEGNKNDGTSGTWEGDFNPNGTPGALAGAGPVHDFGDSGQSLLVPSGGGNSVILSWAEHATLSNGYAATDYDLYDMDGGLTTIFDASTDVQDGAGGDDFPFEMISAILDGERLVVTQFAAGNTSSVPMFNLIVFRGEVDQGLATNGATRGHSAAAAAFSVAASPAAAAFDGNSPSGPYPGLFSASSVSENFTSDGPRRVLLDGLTGNELTPGNRTSTGGVVRQKPDITAADGVSTAAPGFDPFFGTSAAAPHAAAIAALLKSAVNSLTPAQIRTALVGSAIDIELPGTDRDTGAGIVMAHAALQAAGATPQAFLSAGAAVPTELLGDGDAYIENNEIWNLAVPLTNNGGATATAISAVLSSSTPGITIGGANSAYPDIAVGASGSNITPFQFAVGSATPCGGQIDFTLTVSFSGGSSPQTFNFSVRTGSPGTPVTTSYSGAVVAIPDGGDLSGSAPGALVSASLPISGIVGNIYSTVLSIDGSSCNATAGSTTVGLDHSYVGDLQITLAAPGGGSALVINHVGGSGNNFCHTVLDDTAATSIQTVVSSQAPFTGTFAPNSPLAALNGQNPNGTWQLQAQDFYSTDTGNIRAFSVQVTPAVCDAPQLAPHIVASKTVSGGNLTAGGNVVYTVVLQNNGSGPQMDNAGDEFSDLLPAGLTAGTPSATSGTVSGAGSNPVTWNGSIPAGGSVTITIPATIASGTAGQQISNQGMVNVDADENGSNETLQLTNDTTQPGSNNPTVFTVVAPPAPLVAATKTVSGGNRSAGGNVVYTIVLHNIGNATQGDNPGHEFSDTLPAQLTAGTPTATSGTVSATGVNPVTWDGSIPSGGSVTITIPATIHSNVAGQTISNQGTVNFDSDGDGSNDLLAPTNDPSEPGAENPTVFVALAAARILVPVPATSPFGLLLIVFTLALGAWFGLRQRAAQR